jgi:hypothetical protein
MIWKVPKLAVYPSPVLRSPCSAIHLPRAHTRNTYSQHTCVRLSGPACLPSSSSYLLHVHLPASHLDRCVRPGPLPSVQDPRHSCHQFCRRGSARHTNPRCTLILAVRYPPPPASYHADQRRVQHCCCPKSLQHHHCQFAPQFTPQFTSLTARSTSRANFTPPSRPLHVSPPTIGFISALEPLLT